LTPSGTLRKKRRIQDTKKSLHLKEELGGKVHFVIKKKERKKGDFKFPGGYCLKLIWKSQPMMERGKTRRGERRTNKRACAFQAQAKRNIKRGRRRGTNTSGYDDKSSLWLLDKK